MCCLVLCCELITRSIIIYLMYGGWCDISERTLTCIYAFTLISWHLAASFCFESFCQTSMMDHRCYFCLPELLLGRPRIRICKCCFNILKKKCLFENIHGNTLLLSSNVRSQGIMCGQNIMSGPWYLLIFAMWWSTICHK